MKLGKQLYLVLERLEDSRHKAKLVPDLRDALVDWKSSTRISPVFAIASSAAGDASRHSFPGDSFLFFVGPVHPEKVISACTVPPSAVWVGFGLLNVIVALGSRSEQRELVSFARARGLTFESWRLEDGVVRSAEPGGAGVVGDFGARLGRLASKSVAPEVREALYEYCPLMASTISRSQPLPAGLRDNLLKTHAYIEQAVREAGLSGEDASYGLLGQLLMINAGLSRFSSQTFAGTVPISETECHFWTHSLLGIGVPSIGLWRITDFLERKLGQARLPERFARLDHFAGRIPDLCRLDINDPFWTADHLGAIAVEDKSKTPLVPLLAYFSARDGFRSTVTTISAPLASVASCNSPRWSLLTLTHEVSHILVRGMLVSLYPDLDDPKDLERAKGLLDRRAGRNLLDEIARYLYITVVMIDKVHSEIKGPREFDAEKFAKLLIQWRREVEEICVHVFDFLYFYGNDVSKYVSGIWASWGTIPNVRTRIPDYVVRTISTVLAKNLRRRGGEEIARSLVTRALKNLQRTGMGGEYVSDALAYIAAHWKDEIKPHVLARKGLVKIAKTFFLAGGDLGAGRVGDQRRGKREGGLYSAGRTIGPTDDPESPEIPGALQHIAAPLNA
jgi:hypothetical protein